MKPVSAEQSLFAEALQRVTPAERAAYLDEACRGDAALRRRVEDLLRAAASAGDFLEYPPSDLVDDSDEGGVPAGLAEKPGDRIGRYKLLQQIGEGGCGVVYMAEQEEPVQRRVALKILKPGMDTRAVVARFEAERQALALMDHPNIARVFDGGATPTGRPYFVMELVRGVRVTEFCDEARLGTEARLRLFVQICLAVQHAHQKGVIHRDLKPSNILVTVNDGVPVPKVIDFGIAKASGQRLTDKTLFTQFHSFLGTPAYTSPEQVEMSSVDVDTRSDIYSLGVLLYELLTGCTPFDGEELLRSGLDELRRVIRDEEPVRPSARLTRERAAADLGKLGTPSGDPPGAEGNRDTRRKGAARRAIPLHELVPQLRADLDWIVMKCLEKDRSRRYETASALAADIQRHLNHEPIVARPPGQWYRFRKMVRRNRTTVAAFAGIGLALVAGLTVSVWQAVRAHRGEARAQAALADLRASAPAYAAQARGLADQGKFAEAIEKLDQAVRLRPDSTEYLLSKANLHESLLEFAAAAPVYRAVLRLDPNHPRAQTNLALCEQLRRLDPAQPPQWQDTLGALFVHMLQEQRPAVEVKRIADLVLEHTRRRIGASGILAGLPVDKHVLFHPNGWIDLDLKSAPIHDISPLAGMPLALGRVKVRNPDFRDLGPVKGWPLITLDANGSSVADIEPLRGMTGLSSLSLAGTAVTNLDALRGTAVNWMNLTGTPLQDLTPVRELPLTVLRLRGTQVTNLAPLAGMSLRELDCAGIPAKDFAPLAECSSLTHVDFSYTSMQSLDVFRRCRLVQLRINSTPVNDLSPLAGMPLQVIQFTGTQVTNVAALLQCPTLEEIRLPREVQNVAVLRSLPKLRRISYHRDAAGGPAQTADEFWRAYDAAKETGP